MWSSYVLFVLISCIADFTHSQCINPNGQYGYCISLYDCPPLISVAMKKPLRDMDVRFLREAACYEGFGRAPLVCCNDDVGFYPQNQPMRQAYRDFAFPMSGEATPQRGRPQTQGRNPNTALSSAKLPTPPQCGVDGVSQKIYGGVDADLDEFPWMVLLIYGKAGQSQITMNCGGSLISDRYVLTAAHCLKSSIISKVGKLKYVRLGEYDVSKPLDCSQSGCTEAIQVGVERSIPHENFLDNDSHRHNDIGLVKLDRSVQFTEYIRPICLPFMLNADNPMPGSDLIVAGWGRTLNARRATVKQKLTVRATSLEECRRKFKTKMVDIVDSQLCAGGVHREDSCDGDSGGPLMRFYKNTWVLEGVVSFGIRCGFSDWPAVHARVASYENWIKANIR